ncbi:hypothetical protein GCM10011511_43250 [Puia dinghuensis]|uniref:Uncharacterized protein n=1 Tax=Puia dinghuensis TaxID=1792502 RepID=A0A8J2XUW9_9BACT|nr:hypothetical protein GCM10011511_43250 [Puia dinghuensis]
MLEWTGWYTSSVRLRLLGHYRLYQLYRKHRYGRSRDVPPIHGYILQYRASNGIKFRLATLFSRFPAILGFPDRTIEIYAINKMLLYERAAILYEFLASADADFEKAFGRAIDQIYSPEFLNTAALTQHQHSSLFVQVDQHNMITDAHNELNIHPIVEKETMVKEVIIKETVPGAPDKAIAGKEKDVFSKRQVLIFFDLLAQSPPIDRIALDPPINLLAKAQFFRALTSKGVETWLKTLRDYRKGLYECHTSDEIENLISVLTNLAEFTHAAGLRAVTAAAEKKVHELQAKRAP